MQLGKEKDNFPVKIEQNGNWPPSNGQRICHLSKEAACLPKRNPTS
jgi:hypothetical protein